VTCVRPRKIAAAFCLHYLPRRKENKKHNNKTVGCDVTR
jgi:hypothetical protein